MTRHRFMEGGVYVEGKRFSLDKVLDAYERIIDHLVATFADTASRVTTSRKGFERPLIWNGDGKAEVLRAWRLMRGHYDAVDEAFVHSIGPLSVKAYLLGKTWCIYHPMEDRIATPTGEPVGVLDPVPMICLYGARDGDRYLPVPDTDMALVEKSVSEGSLPLGVTAEIAAIRTRAGVPAGRFGWLYLPHDVYGDGNGPILVRCVLPDGSEVPGRFHALLS